MYRWFKSLNVAVASERQQRKLAKEIVDQTIVAECGAFTFSLERGRTEIREVPFVYRPNLIAAIADLVDQHHRYKTRILFFILVHHRSYHRSRAGLTWHNGAIPSNEIWVKLHCKKWGVTVHLCYGVLGHFHICWCNVTLQGVLVQHGVFHNTLKRCSKVF